MDELKVIWVKCEYEGGAFQDYCWTCAPWWEKYPICPQCHNKVRPSKGPIINPERFWCPICRKHLLPAATTDPQPMNKYRFEVDSTMRRDENDPERRYKQFFFGRIFNVDDQVIHKTDLERDHVAAFFAARKWVLEHGEFIKGEG